MQSSGAPHLTQRAQVRWGTFDAEDVEAVSHNWEHHWRGIYNLGAPLGRAQTVVFSSCYYPFNCLIVEIELLNGALLGDSDNHGRFIFLSVG
jgi:hypothetical protein